MPAPYVTKVADKVDGLSEDEAEDIWNEVKQSLQDEGEIADNEEDITDRGWGLVTSAFKRTIASRFDISISQLESKERDRMYSCECDTYGVDRNRAYNPRSVIPRHFR